MSINGYIRVKNSIEKEIIIEKSRFICYTKMVETEDDAKAFIDEIRKKHAFATHNCYAYVVEGGKVARFSDDGEPGGTAGMPMVQVLQKENLYFQIVIDQYVSFVQ